MPCEHAKLWPECAHPNDCCSVLSNKGCLLIPLSLSCQISMHTCQAMLTLFMSKDCDRSEQHYWAERICLCWLQVAPTILATFMLRSSCLRLFKRPLFVQSVHAAVDLDTYDKVSTLCVFPVWLWLDWLSSQQTLSESAPSSGCTCIKTLLGVKLHAAFKLQRELNLGDLICLV